MIDFTELEKNILKLLLEGEDEMLTNLRTQFKTARVTKRERSGVGFFTYIKVDGIDQIHSSKSFKFGDVHAEISGIDEGAGFLLHIKNGILEMLEGYTYDEQWPANSKEFEINYINGKRDLNEIKAKWS